MFKLTSNTSLNPEYDVETQISTYPPSEYPVGAVMTSYLRGEDDPEFFAVPGVQRFTNPVERVERLLGDYSAPIVVDGELRWTDEWFSGE